MTDPAIAGADRAPKPVDMTGVDPARWREVRRRVSILDEFVAMHRPPLAVRTAFAHRMGLSVSQFMMLARVWRITRRASAIPGARSRIAVTRARRLPARSIGIMRETIADLGPIARRKDVLAEVGRRCAAEGIASPSGSTIANALADSRTDMASIPGSAPEILIDECLVKLPVARGDAIVMPHVLLAIALPERRVLAAAISCDPLHAPSPSTLMADLQAACDHLASLPIRAAHHPDLERRVDGHATSSSPADMPSLGRVLGNRLGDLRILHRATMARPVATLVAARHASALDAEEAATAIMSAVASHNDKVARRADTGR
ncbi:MAG: hypothetical protein C0474_00590 [Sphingobium sp.]|nr:hypothetical protein [Sphingobium sp.]